MKVLLIDQDREKISNLLENLKQARHLATLWQNIAGKRRVYLVQLSAFNQKALTFESFHKKNINFLNDYPIYLYCEKMRFIARSFIESLDQVKLNVSIFSQVNLLDGFNREELDAIKVKGSTEKISDAMKVKRIDEDVQYAHMREAPRKKVSKTQFVTIRFETKKFSEKEYELFDMSTGGAGFITKTPEKFEKSDILHFIKIDQRELDPALRAEVMSVRSHDVEKGLFKIGVRFAE
jgi:hypothetical protein